MMALRILRGLVSPIFEPAGLGLKAIALALFAAHPSWTGALFVLIVVTSISISLVARTIYSGEIALRSLYSYIGERETRDWIRTTPFTSDELRRIYGFQHLELNFALRSPSRQLYMVTYTGNTSLDCRCYFNIAGSSFILTPNANVNFHQLPLAQKFVVFHEIGHASFAGGEIWTKGQLEVIAIVLAIGFAATTTTHWPWWAMLFGGLGGAILLLRGSDQFRNEMAETFADRYALREIEQEDPKHALSIAEQLTGMWQQALKQNPGPPRRRKLELMARLRNLAFEIHGLERITQGKLAVNVDRLPAIFKTLPLYAWATVLFFWVLLDGGLHHDFYAEFGLVGFVVLLAACQFVLWRSLRRVSVLESNIKSKCRHIETEERMPADRTAAKELVKMIDPVSADWIPDASLNDIIDAVMNGQNGKQIIADRHTEDSKNAPFSAAEILAEIVAIAVVIKATWEAVGFTGKVLELVVDNDKKLQICETVVLRLRQAGLEVAADRVQGWIDTILERITRPR